MKIQHNSVATAFGSLSFELMTDWFTIDLDQDREREKQNSEHDNSFVFNQKFCRVEKIRCNEKRLDKRMSIGEFSHKTFYEWLTEVDRKKTHRNKTC